MIDITTLLALFAGFSAVIGFLFKILQYLAQLLEKADKNASDIKELRVKMEADNRELRADVEIEFALCRMHDRCNGVMLADKSASDDEK